MPMHSPLLLILLLIQPFQVRNYSVEVKGVGTGSYRQEHTEKPDGTCEVASSSSLRAKVFLISYRYDFKATETWKDGKLIYASATKDDNGTQTKMSATAGMADWTSSFWTLPDNRNGTIKILDYDTGRIVQCTLKFIEADKTGRHWKVSGGMETDLWFDQNGFLVKRTMLRHGKATTVTLTRS